MGWFTFQRAAPKHVVTMYVHVQCFQPIEGTHNNFDNSYCFYHKIVTIGPMVLKCAENVHTSFYSVYASFEGFSSIDSKVTKDQATRNNYPK